MPALCVSPLITISERLAGIEFLFVIHVDLTRSEKILIVLGVARVEWFFLFSTHAIVNGLLLVRIIMFPIPVIGVIGPMPVLFWDSCECWGGFSPIQFMLAGRPAGTREFVYWVPEEFIYQYRSVRP